MLHFRPPETASHLTYPLLGAALERLDTGVPGTFAPGRTRRMATLILPPAGGVTDAVWNRLGCLQRARYEVWALLVGAVDPATAAHLEANFDRVFGPGEFAQRVRHTAADKRALGHALVSVRGQFGWIGPALSHHARITGPELGNEGLSQHAGSIELAFCGFSNFYRSAQCFEPALVPA